MVASPATQQPTFFTTKPSGQVRWTVDLWRRADELGLFPPLARYELLNGELYYVPTPTSEHDGTVEDVRDYLRDVLGDVATVREEKIIYIAEDSTPRPDLSIVKPGRYKKTHATPADTYLIVEVCYSNKTNDLGIKPKLYAAANIPEYWAIDIKARQLKRFHSLANGQYQETVITTESKPVSIAGISVDIAAISQLAFETE